MNKPISMIINETKDNIISVISDSKLPACILELILKDLYKEIKDLSDKQLKMDQQEYGFFLVEQERQAEQEKQSEENKQNEEEV